MLALRTVTYCTENEETPTRLELAEMKGRVQALEKSLADALAKAKEGAARPLMRAPVKQVAKRRSLR